MGFNTTVLILNDAFGEIEEHPEEFVEKLRPFINGGPSSFRYNDPMGQRDRREGPGKGDVSFSVGRHGNAASVIDVQHADATQVIMVGGNCATLLGEAYYTGGHHTKEGIKEALNQVLKDYGLKVIEDKPRTVKRIVGRRIVEQEV